jgi:atypical dual specificity phosphatase
MMDMHEIARRVNFSFVIPGRLAGMGWPVSRQFSAEQMGEFLVSQSIKHVVNLTESDYPHAGWKGIRCHHFPVEDWTPPGLQVIDFCSKLLDELGDTGALAVHCAAGIGRTGTVLAALLGKELDLDAMPAVYSLRSLRPGSVETRAQEERVAQWLGRD